MQAHFCQSALAKQRKNQQTPLADYNSACPVVCVCNRCPLALPVFLWHCFAARGTLTSKYVSHADALVAET